MKKMRILFAAVGAVMIAYVIVSASAVSAPQESGEPSVGIAESEPRYVLREENNRVVVYQGDTLWLKTDTPVSQLPKGDRARLRRGIAVNSDTELKRLLEDYCS